MNIRKIVGKAVKKHRVAEGACYSGGYYYFSFGNLRKKKTIIVKMTKDLKVVKISSPLKVGHCNDMCERDGILYITHSGKKNVIHRVNAKTLKKLENTKVKGYKNGRFNAITCFGNGFMLKQMASKKIIITDKKFNYLHTVKLSETMKLGQGMTWAKGKLYRASSVKQSRKNYICVYSSKGKLLDRIHYNHKGELEDVMMVDGKLMLYIHRKKKTKKGKKKFKALLKKVG